MTRPDLAEVLAAVNALRAEHAIGEPLTEMPKQGPSRHEPQCCTCPMTVALDADASHPYGFVRRAELKWHGLPPVCSAFIHAFDRGEYPELIAEAS